jgi:hypothetical protein
MRPWYRHRGRDAVIPKEKAPQLPQRRSPSLIDVCPPQHGESALVRVTGATRAARATPTLMMLILLVFLVLLLLLLPVFPRQHKSSLTSQHQGGLLLTSHHRAHAQSHSRRWRRQSRPLPCRACLRPQSGRDTHPPRRRGAMRRDRGPQCRYRAGPVPRRGRRRAAAAAGRSLAGLGPGHGHTVVDAPGRPGCTAAAAGREHPTRAGRTAAAGAVEAGCRRSRLVGAAAGIEEVGRCPAVAGRSSTAAAGAGHRRRTAVDEEVRRRQGLGRRASGMGADIDPAVRRGAVS